MTDTFNKLKMELKVYYPDFTDDELDEATENLIKFFTIGAKITFETKDAPKGTDPIQDTNDTNSTSVLQ